MVLEMVLLERAVPRREVAVVQEVMRQVVADVAEDAAAEDAGCDVPVVEKDGVGELPEGCGKDEEESRRHNEPVAVHGKVVMDTVEEEVERKADTVVGEVSGIC